MATMATATVRKINQALVVLLPLLLSTKLLAGDWKITPKFGIEETYSDNVTLAKLDTRSSFVTQTQLGIDVDFISRAANLTLSGINTYAAYSHDSKLNDDYHQLNAQGSLLLWTNGPKLLARSQISNVSKSNIKNSLADIVSGDTTEQQTHAVGFNQHFGNSTYNLDSQVIYDQIKTQDNLGASEGYNASIIGATENKARHLFWKIDANYTDRKNKTLSGQTYKVTASIGPIFSSSLIPILRFYDEGIKGNIAGQGLDTTPSWGPGLVWQPSTHFAIDLSYNFVKDKEKSDDYIASNLTWQPSTRTLLELGYSQRFFGDAYHFSLEHKNKRLSNNISYTEAINAFDRNQFFEGEIVESNDFILNKLIDWQSELQLTRTKFLLTVKHLQRENLTNKVTNRDTDATINIERKLNSRSIFTIDARFRHVNYNQKIINISIGQDDYYRTIAINYTRKLNASLSTIYTIEHLNRDSTVAVYNYNEVRAVINLTKEF